MYLNILKKDLTRKRTMNLILLMFIILAVMFVSSSANNLAAITSSLDAYFDKANMSDYAIATKGISSEEKNIKEIIKDLDYVDSCSVEDCIYISQTMMTKSKDGKIMEMSGTGMITPLESSHIKFFDNNLSVLKNINDGEIYLKKAVMSTNDISVGDKIKITIGDTTLEFIVKGYVKDALLGSSMMGMPRLLVSQNDFNKLSADEKSDLWKGQLIFINTDNTKALEQKLMENSDIIFMGDKSMIKTTYIMDMIIAGVLLVVSVCLILIAFIILKFTITFTLSEEYREIGIMKAIGIKNRKIRGLYMVKYLAMSLAGAVIGLICGIPFGDMLLQQASENIIINKGQYWINIVCAIVVIGIIMLFCYGCTGKVKKFTPVDAIRNGTTGERYRKKGVLKLSKSRLRPVLFMALNDILSGLKRFATMMITFTIGILLITIITNTITTLKSDRLVSWFAMAESDVYLEDASSEKYMVSGGRDILKNELKHIEDELAENDIEAKCFAETFFKFTVSKGEYSCKSLASQGTGTTTDQYTYIEGTAPQNTGEVALTHIIADKIHAKIGDTVTIKTSQGNKKYIVTAIYQSMNNMGEGIRLHENEEFDYSQAMGFFSYQVKYTDNPSESQINGRMELIKEIFPDYTARKGGEYIDYMIGGIAGYMGGLKSLIISVVLIICMLVAVLMEKSFLTKEKGEIAMLKATGFTNSSVILWQTLRISVVMIISVILAVILSEPLGQLAVGGIFKMMGAYNIIFDINVLETYIVYPLAIFAATVLSVFVTAQQIRKISSSEINNIE